MKRAVDVTEEDLKAAFNALNNPRPAPDLTAEEDENGIVTIRSCGFIHAQMLREDRDALIAWDGKTKEQKG